MSPRRLAPRSRPRDVDRPWPSGPVPIATGTAEVRRAAEDPDLVTLYVNDLPSSALSLTDPTFLEFEYMTHMLAAIDASFPAGSPVRAVHVGAGACALPRAIEATRPGSRQLAIEIDDRLADLVREWFPLPRSPRLRIRVQDGLAALTSRPPASADIVVRDAFDHATTPPHLVSAGFVEQAARVVAPDGLYLVNCADPHLANARREAFGTLEHFAHVAVILEPAQLRGRREGNVVIVASHRPVTDAAMLTRRLAVLPAPARLIGEDDIADFAMRSTAPPAARS